MSFPGDLQEILVKLEFLSQVTEGCKINTKDMSLSPVSSWMSSIKRTITREDRSLTVHYINETIRNTTQIIERYKDHEEYIGVLISAFERAKTGIEHLNETYQTSSNIVANIRVALANIDLQLRSLRERSDAGVGFRNRPLQSFGSEVGREATQERSGDSTVRSEPGREE